MVSVVVEPGPLARMPVSWGAFGSVAEYWPQPAAMSTPHVSTAVVRDEREHL
jgi:hypothetical protein